MLVLSGGSFRMNQRLERLSSVLVSCARKFIRNNLYRSLNLLLQTKICNIYKINANGRLARKEMQTRVAAEKLG